MFVEQPLGYDDIEGLRKLARGTKVPIGVDEGIHSFADIVTSAKAGAGGVSLKLIKLGGISRGDRGRQALPEARACR